MLCSRDREKPAPAARAITAAAQAVSRIRHPSHAMPPAIYLDHNATTPPAPEVADALARALVGTFGNPSSIHAFGQRAKTALDDARTDTAALVGADPGDIVFTGGGTESDNLALRGVVEALAGTPRTRLIISAVEHEAVVNTAKALARRGCQVTTLPVDGRGRTTPEALAPLLGPDVALVSVMTANNETGVVQPVAEIAALAHAHGALVHTDAVQSTGKVRTNVRELGIDLLTLTAHKFRGPKGVGALWIRRGTRLAGTLTGGRQERSRRAGTENVPAIVGLGVAARLARERMDGDGARMGALRDRLEQGILAAVPGTCVNGAGAPRVPNTTNISFEHVEAESLLIALDLEGIAVSTGSACSSGTLEPSHVLRAMGLPPSRVQGSLRFSLGATTTDEEIDRVLQVLPALVARIRRVGRG
jgi:cysteine desulfurase